MNRERAIRELESVEMMTRRWKEYLAICEMGGDWMTGNFMNHLNDTTKAVRESLEIVDNFYERKEDTESDQEIKRLRKLLRDVSEVTDSRVVKSMIKLGLDD